MTHLLEVDNVVAGYGSGPDILRGMSLKVDPGQIQCIIGPNGAGKSTVLKVIAGLIHPRQGEVRYKGERISHLRPDQVLERGICFVPQERALFGDMTVVENLRMGGYLNRDRKGVEYRIEEVFDMFPILREKAGHRARTLSGGQQQMLVMGRTLVLKPEIVMLDEPSLGLAPKIVSQVFEIIGQLRSLGITVLLVEQNAVRGLQCADWGVVLDLGCNHFEGPSSGILGDPRIQELYLGKARFRQEAVAP